MDCASKPNTSVASAINRRHVTSSLSKGSRLLIAGEEHSKRKQIETFIANGFCTHYNATISQFMPLIFALEQNGIKAAVGVRYGIHREKEHPLFVEQYLTMPIENTLVQHGINTNRADIVEVGNLLSCSARYTIPLLLSLLICLKKLNVQYLIFTATSQLAQLLRGAGITLRSLGKADPARLTEHRETWGTYYDTAPEVMALSLDTTSRCIQSCASLNTHYQNAIRLISFTNFPQQLDGIAVLEPSENYCVA
ncbi:thermostable hemolysin [Aestuariibacter sp. A3R04]|uniref:thermostable hemolysin n=1 Tax=Aestuariibacter sp. A3R04 TaxID=2841571 RepID=UPI001C09BC4D|nr:thermostable hemolysin [Aestuariibacter sp. A3R04]MBU3022026.1 thermostable hemolysin [Aestuariibacter sp. A3R04]